MNRGGRSSVVFGRNVRIVFFDNPGKKTHHGSRSHRQRPERSRAGVQLDHERLTTGGGHRGMIPVLRCRCHLRSARRKEERTAQSVLIERSPTLSAVIERNSRLVVTERRLVRLGASIDYILNLAKSYCMRNDVLEGDQRRHVRGAVESRTDQGARKAEAESGIHPDPIGSKIREEETCLEKRGNEDRDG
ncbi:hypothetical protein C8R44DRAFT_750738 [Mycena epipterygia]|nr:hypothetical protein C8R44DRAFT_750738 [Mycena epipterygia]